jgi:4-hydroxybenzoate polyprenyltransferase
MRFANTFTAMADVMAGYLIVSGANFQWSALIGLCIASAALYAGGCVLNDICDRELDAAERPFRPIPSKQVSLAEAWLLLVILFALGLLAAMYVGFPTFVTALVLILLIIAYDAVSKDIVIFGALNMGACRSCNLILGMSLAFPLQGAYSILPLISLLYVSCLTALSKFEVHGGAKSRGLPVLAGWFGVIFFIVGLKFFAGLNPWMFVYLLIFIVYTGPTLLRGIRDMQARSIGLAVKTMVLAIPILDAAYCSGFQGFFFGIPVLLCIAPAVLIARRLYVT